MTVARTIAVQDQVLAVLRDESPLPASTQRICERIGVHRYSDEGLVVYRVLDRLARRGDVERIRLDGFPQAYWRRWDG